MIKKYLTIVVLLLSFSSFAQNISPTDVSKNANQTKSGATNDILTNYYQLSLQNLATNGQLSFSSTIFGLLDLDSMNKKIEVDSNYKKYKWARNIQITATGKLDTNSTTKLKDYSIASYSGGLTISIINHREINDRNDKQLQALEDNQHVFSNANRDAEEAMHTLEISPQEKKVINSSIDKFRGSHNPKDLDPRFVAALKSQDTYEEFTTDFIAQDSVFKLVTKKVKERGLWTVGGIYSKYNKGSNRDTINFNMNYLKGFLRKDGGVKKPWELNLSGNIKLFQPSVSISKLTELYYTEVGINKILMEDKKGNSTMELKFFGSYNNYIDSAYNKKDIAANFTYRILFFKTFWLPITIKYDLGGNLFGNFNITFNIDKTKTSSSSSK